MSEDYNPMTLAELDEWWREFEFRWGDLWLVISRSPDRRSTRRWQEGFRAQRMRGCEDALRDQLDLIRAEYLMLRERIIAKAEAAQ